MNTNSSSAKPLAKAAITATMASNPLKMKTIPRKKQGARRLLDREEKIGI
jgi:hypothetical protein